MSTRQRLSVAVIGASGNVGRKIVEQLLQRQSLTASQLKLFASKKSTGKKIKIAEHEWTLENTETIKFEQFDLVLFATDSDVSKKYIGQALDKNAVVVDSSSLHRLDKAVDLIVSPVNKHLVDVNKAKLYSISNCVSSPVSTVIAPIHHQFPITRLIISTYQSVSGAGKQAMDEILQESAAVLDRKKYKRQYFQRQIAFNVIPQIDYIMDDGFTYEEFKIMREIKKIVDGDFEVTATAARVPVEIGHSVSMSIEFSCDVTVDQIRGVLKKAPSVSPQFEYMTPSEVVGSDEVHVGRIRKDPTIAHGIQLWLCSDNLRRGAATDMVEVATEIINQLNDKAG